MKGKKNIGFPTDFMVLLVGSGGVRSYVWSADGTLQTDSLRLKVTGKVRLEI